MSKLIQYKIIFIALLFLSIPSISTFCQTSTTVSKSCGKCGRSVSQYAKAGDKCPYCGVTWGKENTSKSSTNSEYPSSNQTSTYGGNQGIIDDSKATKAETEAWILEKFRKYSENDFHCNDLLHFTGCVNYENYKFSFDGYNFIISYDYIPRGGKSSITLINIPIYDIRSVSGFDDRLAMESFGSTILDYSSFNKSTSTSKFFSLKFKYNSETDLDKRINKAFQHLKKFYKKPISNEAF